MDEAILIKRIKVDGEYKFDKSFESGLHILVGEDNSCGKSLFIKLIDFALGDDGRELKSYNVLKKCTFFYAEIKVNNKLFTIRRNINVIDKNIEFFKNKTITDLLRDSSIKYEAKKVGDYQKMLFKELTEYDYIGTVSSTGKKKTLSFSFFSNLFYLNQGVEAGQLFRYNKIFFPEYLREKIFSLYLDTNKIKTSSSEIKLQDFKKEYQEKLNNLNITRKFFSENVSGNNYFGERERKDKILKRMEILDEKLREVNSKIMSLNLISEDEQKSLFNKNKELGKNLNEESETLEGIKQNTKLLNDYREDIYKTEQNISAFQFFKKFELFVCPECGRKLKKDLIEDTCPLCKEGLEEKNNNQLYLQKNMNYLSYLKDSMNDTIEIIEKDKADLKIFSIKEEKLSEGIKKIELNINKKLELIKNPVVKEQTNTHSEISKLNENLETVEKNIRILSSFRKTDQELEKIKRNMEILKREIDFIEQDEENFKKEGKLLEDFRENFEDFFNNQNYPFFERISIEKNFDIEVTTSKDATQKMNKINSQSDRIIIRLGLFYSLLKTSLENKEINHPRLLYLDSPRDQELKWERFCESLKKYKDLLEKNGKGQVFITVVEDAKNKFEGNYSDLNKNVFLRIDKEEGKRLLRKDLD